MVNSVEVVNLFVGIWVKLWGKGHKKRKKVFLLLPFFVVLEKR